MKILALIIGVIVYVAFAGFASADPRIELDTDSCHFPYDAIDTDNEWKLTCDGNLYETAADGAIKGWAKVKYHDVPRETAPENATVYSDESDTDCVLQNDDGTEAQIADWVVKIRSRCSRWRCSASYQLLCGYTP